MVHRHIMRMAKEMIHEKSKGMNVGEETAQGNKPGTKEGVHNRVVVLDAAVLIEAKWTEMCDEVWVVFVPKEEQIKRVVERDGKSKQEAEKRLNSQMTTEAMLQHAHVALTTLYEPEITRGLVKKAMGLLKNRISSDPGEEGEIKL